MPVSATKFALKKKHRKLVKKIRSGLIIFIIYVLVHHVDWKEFNDSEDDHYHHHHEKVHRQERQIYAAQQKRYPDEPDAWNSKTIIRKGGKSVTNFGQVPTTPPVRNVRDVRSTMYDNRNNPHQTQLINNNLPFQPGQLQLQLQQQQLLLQNKGQTNTPNQNLPPNPMFLQSGVPRLPTHPLNFLPPNAPPPKSMPFDPDAALADFFKNKDSGNRNPQDLLNSNLQNNQQQQNQQKPADQMELNFNANNPDLMNLQPQVIHRSVSRSIVNEPTDTRQNLQALHKAQFNNDPSKLSYEQQKAARLAEIMASNKIGNVPINSMKIDNEGEDDSGVRGLTLDEINSMSIEEFDLPKQKPVKTKLMKKMEERRTRQERNVREYRIKELF